MRFFVLAAVLALLAGCSAPNQTGVVGCEQPPLSLEQVDLGLTVASAANGAAAIVAALGGQSSILASDLASDVGVEVIDPGHQIAVEKLLALRPEVVFISSEEPDDVALSAIATLDARVVALDSPITFEDSMDQITQIAQALGVPERGVELREIITNSIRALDTSALTDKAVAFLYLRGNAGVFLMSGSESGADDIIRLLGANDVGLELGISGFAPISPEALANANPDFIIVMEKGLESVGGIEGLVRLPGIMGTTAASNRGILSAKDSQLLSFGPATASVLQCLLEQAR